MRTILDIIEKREVVKRCYTSNYIENLEQSDNKYYQEVMNAYNAFKTEDNLFVVLEMRKSDISKTLYYNDEYKSPAITEENFISYNLRMNFNEIDFSRPVFVERSRNESDIYLIGNYTFSNRCLTEEEKSVISEIYENAKNDYILRLKKYFKRYENKISTYGYWADK